MIYITKRRIKNGEVTDELLSSYFNQFDEQTRYIMSGHIFFLGDLFEYISRELDRDNIPAQQENAILRASSLIGYLTEDFIDSLTDLYAGIEDSYSSPTLTHDEAFITGYRNSLSHYTETTHKVLGNGTFRGKDETIARTFYTALGIELGQKLAHMMESPSLIPVYCAPDDVDDKPLRIDFKKGIS